MKDKPIKLKGNEYWGRRGGMIHPTRGPIFKIKKWANGKENSGRGQKK